MRKLIELLYAVIGIFQGKRKSRYKKGRADDIYPLF